METGETGEPGEPGEPGAAGTAGTAGTVGAVETVGEAKEDWGLTAEESSVGEDTATPPVCGMLGSVEGV